MNNINRTIISLAILGGVVGLIGFVALRKGGQLAGNVVQAVNPVNPDNIFNTGVNAVVKTISGDPDATLGDRIFALFNPNAPGETQRSIDEL